MLLDSCLTKKYKVEYHYELLQLLMAKLYIVTIRSFVVD
jgi:hypothetical protein